MAPGENEFDTPAMKEYSQPLHLLGLKFPTTKIQIALTPSLDPEYRHAEKRRVGCQVK